MVLFNLLGMSGFVLFHRARDDVLICLFLSTTERFSFLLS